MKLKILGTGMDISWKHIEIFIGSLILLAILSAPLYFIDLAAYAILVPVLMAFAFPVVVAIIGPYLSGRALENNDIASFTAIYLGMSLLSLAALVVWRLAYSGLSGFVPALLSLLDMLFSLPFSALGFFAILHLAARFEWKKAYHTFAPVVIGYAIACAAYWLMDFIGVLSYAFSAYGMRALAGVMISHIGQFIYLFAIAYMIFEGRFAFANKFLAISFAGLVLSAVAGYMFNMAASLAFGSSQPDSLQLFAYYAFLAVCAIFVYYLASGKYARDFHAVRANHQKPRAG